MSKLNGSVHTVDVTDFNREGSTEPRSSTVAHNLRIALNNHRASQNALGRTVDLCRKAGLPMSGVRMLEAKLLGAIERELIDSARFETNSAAARSANHAPRLTDGDIELLDLDA
jgi:hypothetical protein